MNRRLKKRKRRASKTHEQRAKKKAAVANARPSTEELVQKSSAQAVAEAVLNELNIEQAGATNNHVPQRVNTPAGFIQNVAHQSWKQIKDAARTAGIESSDKDVWGYVVRFMAKAAQQSISY